ncbi:hypothetical protein [Deefgea piscis]|uniref:hypothetical protein n=1 Tax=Deefgea piscis TaxID=2739061 RepID=UPI001C7FABDE|nr:hypothetical protein [Deefgea piscis]QZA80659.1 hypothetical protein K4H25_14300 [Deefgea piscis]
MKFRTQNLRYGFRCFSKSIFLSRLLFVLLMPSSLVQAYTTPVTSTISGETVDSGTQFVIDGGVVVNGLVTTPATQEVLSGGIVRSSHIDGKQIVYSGGLLQANDVVGSQYVNSGGRADQSNITGRQYISAGGVVNSALINTGYQYNAGLATDTRVVGGGIQVVQSGGQAVRTTVNNGQQGVVSGGLATATTVISGSQIIYSGGVATNATVLSGSGQYIYSGGLASGTQVVSGTQSVYVGGSATNTLVEKKGAQYVQGSVSNTVISGGSQDIVAGVASFTTLNAGADQLVTAGSAVSTTLNGNSNQSILSGGVAKQTILNDSNQDVGAGGQAFDTTVGSGSDQTIEGIATRNMIAQGGRQFVSAGGIANDSLLNGGFQQVLSGGLASATTVAAGNQRIELGGVASSTILGAADQVVLGRANNTVINGGRQFIDAGGIASGNIFNAGTQQITSGGRAIDTQLLSASQFIMSGGLAENTSINSGGRQTVSQGGIATGVHLNGGRMQNNGGTVSELNISGSGSQAWLATGTLAGTTVVSGSNNQLILQGGKVDGTLTIAGSDNRIDLLRTDLSSLNNLRDSTGLNQLSLLNGAVISAATTADARSLTNVLDLQNWGAINIHRGATLVMAGNLALASNATLTNSGTLNVPVNAQLTAGLNNAGMIALGGGGQFSTLNVLGQFQSGNGLLVDHVSANLEKSSMLQVEGSLSGTTRVQFNNDGSSGRLGEQIHFAQSSINTLTRGDTFIAANPVGTRNIYDVRLKGSPYVWEIVQKNVNGRTSWYLQSPFAPPVVPDGNAGLPPQPPLIPPVAIVPVSPEVSPTLKPDRLLPEIPAYGILPAVSEIILRSNLSTLEQRLDAAPNVANDLWMKIDATHLRQSAEYGFSFDGWGSSVTIGIDREGQLDESKLWRGGVFLAWSHNQLNTSGEGGLIHSRASSDLDINSFQTGLYGQLEKDGWYGRAIALLGYERAKVKTEDAYSNTLTAPIWATSLGVGKVFEIFENWTLAPQLNIGYANFNWDLEDESIKGRFEQTSHWYGGASVRVERRINTEENIWLRSGVTHQFGHDSALNLTAPNLYLPAAGPSTTWQMQLGYSKQTNWGSYYGLLGGSWARGQQLGKAELGLQWKW